MNQKQLAAALGLTEAVVSRDAQRGMPTHSVDAARRWRDLNVRPYARSTLQQSITHGFSGAEQQLARLGVVDGKAAVASANVLAATAAKLLQQGQACEFKASLRTALQAVPESMRQDVAMATSVWMELTREVRALFESNADGARQAAQGLPDLPSAGFPSLGAFWYSVAAGEVEVDASRAHAA